MKVTKEETKAPKANDDRPGLKSRSMQVLMGAFDSLKNLTGLQNHLLCLCEETPPCKGKSKLALSLTNLLVSQAISQQVEI
jgi:hypothetical protein